MRLRTYQEATAFVKALLEAKEQGKRELATVKLDSVPAWTGKKTDKEWVPDGSEVEAVYLAYREATDTQKEQAKSAKLAGTRLERISGRLVDVRRCKDGTCQVLMTNGLRDGEGNVPFRGPNVDKGILVCLSINEGLGETVDEAISRVPAAMLDELKANKGKRMKKVVAALPLAQAEAIVKEADKVLVVRRANAVIDVPSTDSGNDTIKLK